MHTDPDDVSLHVLEGTKRIQLDGGLVVRLGAGDSLFIEANTPHEALNEESSVMLSFGLEGFLEDKA